MAIIFRAVREQLEHDRLIRLLQEKFKRHFDVEANVGDDRSAVYKLGTATYYPDLILTSRLPPRRVVAVFEIETAESVNHLEAMAQWAEDAYRVTVTMIRPGVRCRGYRREAATMPWPPRAGRTGTAWCRRGDESNGRLEQVP